MLCCYYYSCTTVCWGYEYLSDALGNSLCECVTPLTNRVVTIASSSRVGRSFEQDQQGLAPHKIN